jgi:electron transfer flavoprotein alpha subunit
VAVNTWIIVAGEPGVKNLIQAARDLGGQVTALVAGPASVAQSVAAGGVDRVIWLGEPDERPVEAYGPAVAQVVGEAPAALIGGRHAAERILLGAAAAAIGAPVFTGVSEVGSEAGESVVTHAVFGGIAEESVVVDGPVALVLDGGGLPATAAAVAVEERVPVTLSALKVVERQTSTVEQADLASAARVVGVGRGLKQKEDLPLIEGLAQAARAEVGCSRPLAEGLEWLGKDRYIGISGQHIAPALYLAIGISGQLQHLDGVRAAGTIVSINSDPQAPIAAESDYVLTGDLYKLVPALTAALS